MNAVYRAGLVIALLAGVKVMARSKTEREEAISLIRTDMPHGGWRFDNGKEFEGATGALSDESDAPKNCRPAIKLDGDFSDGGQYVQAAARLPREDIDKITFMLKYPHSKTVTIRLIDSGGQCHQLVLRLKGGKSWEEIELPLEEIFAEKKSRDMKKLIARREKWGGDNDGKWHGPGKKLVVILGKGNLGNRKSGSLWIGNVQLHPQKPKLTKTVGLDKLDRSGRNEWEFHLGKEFKGAKGECEAKRDRDRKKILVISGDFTKGGMYVAATHETKLSKTYKVKYFRFEMRSDNVTNYGIRLVDQSGQTHQTKGLKFKPDNKWHTVTLRLDEMVGGEHWGGENDGEWHGPKSIAITLAKYSSEDKKPEIAIRGLRAVCRRE